MNAQLHKLMDKADLRGQEGDLTSAEKASVLRDLRKSKARRSDLVVKYKSVALNSAKSEMERLNLYEQIVIAALDLGETAVTETFIQKLIKRFASSSRVERLKGMKCEAEGKFDMALAIYADQLKINPSNMLVMKRKVCIYQAQGRIKEAVEEMHRILRLFASDASTWFELSEVHLSRGEHAEAAHCLEELVMLSPECAHYHTRLADIYYTMGSVGDLLLAKKHYTQSLTLQLAPVNLRSIYGLLATCKALQAEQHKGDAVQKELLAFSIDMVNEISAEQGKVLAFRQTKK